MQRFRGSGPEPRTRNGEVLLSANHLAFLHGLLDRPNGEATSTRDLLAAAVPYLTLYKSSISLSCLQRATRTLHSGWVTNVRRGRCMTWRLTERGRAIVDRTVPARIRGVGPYVGLKPLIGGRFSARMIGRVEARWERWIAGGERAPLVDAIRNILERWSALWPAYGMYASMQRDYNRRHLAAYVRHHVMRRGTLPSGKHCVFPHAHARYAIVDFDKLRAS